MAINPRIRRLMADYQKIKEEFTGSPVVKVEPIGTSNPPDLYRVTYKVPGIALNQATKGIEIIKEHVAEIHLTASYPRIKPKCVLKTPIWHPNFGAYICIGDHWAAGETLVDVIVQIGDMIQYKSFNPKSPLNAKAAVWSNRNTNLFPIGNINLLSPEPEVEIEIELDDPVPVPATHQSDDDLEITLG